MNDPVVRYSPDGAVLLTWELFTHQAVVITRASQAALQRKHVKCLQNTVVFHVVIDNHCTCIRQP